MGVSIKGNQSKGQRDPNAMTNSSDSRRKSSRFVPCADGRKKINVKPLQDTKERMTTFKKRKTGLIKKAMELSRLCGVDSAPPPRGCADAAVALVILADGCASGRSGDGTVIQYCSADIDKTLDKFLHSSPDEAYDNSHYDTFAEKSERDRGRSLHYSLSSDDDKLSPTPPLPSPQPQQNNAPSPPRAADSTPPTPLASEAAPQTPVAFSPVCAAPVQISSPRAAVGAPVAAGEVALPGSKSSSFCEEYPLPSMTTSFSGSFSAFFSL
jgi:hypothetical protein